MCKKSKSPDATLGGIRHGGLICLVSFVLVLASGVVAQAGLNDPPLLNASFEEETSYGQPTPGWYDYDAGNSQWWAFQETRDADPQTTYGDVWGALRPDGILWQKIGTWDAGTSYQIDVLVGNRTTWTNGGIYISLWGGGNEASASDDTYPEAIGATKLSESDILITDEVGGIMEVKEVSTILSTGSGLTPGDPLWIQIINANAAGISYFDYPRIKLDRKASDAVDPNPVNGATDVPREVVLSWTPGMYADKHDVYLGTNLDDVNDASRANPLSVLANQDQYPSIYAPAERLAFSETYYWRIDEVNTAPDNTVFKGRIWQFTVEPIAYAIPAEKITVTASSEAENQGPENTVNGSGLDVNDLHSTEPTDMWLSGGGEPGSIWIEYEFDKVYKLHEIWVWNSNQMVEPMIGLGFKDVSIEYSVNGTDYATLGTTHEFARGTGAADYAKTAVDLNGVAAKHIRLTANSNWGGGMVNQYSLSEVRFFSIPVQAREPSPDSGATDVDVDVTLGLRAGREAVTHDVHLSSDEQAVIDSNALVSTVTEASYGPLSLDLGTTYYWKINEVNEAETPTTWQGEIWNFTTPEFFVVEDFEDYNDYPPDEIWSTWIDGYGVPENGATAGYPDPDFLAGEHYMETTIVHGGEQSMPLFYDNTGTATYSEGKRTFAVPQDWTVASVQTLTLWFYGTAGNTGQLYVEVNGSKVVYDGDAADIQRAGWQPWNIELALFGTNLQSVTTLAIGIDGNGASGTLYFDDIRLYSYSRQFITPTEPNNAGLVAHYKLDQDATDSSGNNNHGTLNGNPQWVAGYLNGALEFDGVDDTVNFGTGPSLGGTSDFSVAAWIKTSATSNGVVIQQRNGGYNGQYRLRVNGSGVLNFMVYAGSYQFNMPTTGSVVNDGNWHYVMAVRQGERGYIYIDGSLQASGSSTFVAPLDALIEVAVGADIRDSNAYFEGTIDDVRIYERPLSYGEVAWLAGRTEPFDKPF